MVSGNSTVEELIPGDPGAIASVVQDVGSGAAPAQQISEAWNAMQIPSWQGAGGNAWRAFTPSESRHMSVAPGAFARVATAMLRYEEAFRAARAEAQAAIADARAAEQATANARESHQDALRRATHAPEGSPAKRVSPFVDPGATSLAAAQVRYLVAKAKLQTVGDEVAAEIRSAAAVASGVNAALGTGGSNIVPVIGLPPRAIPKPDKDRMHFLGEVFTGVGEGLFDSVMGAWKLLPVHFMIDQANGGPGWGDAYAEHWRTLGEGYAFIRVHPIEALGQFGAGMIALDMWESNPPRAAGHVIFNFAGLAGIGRGIFGKFGRGEPEAPAKPLETPKAPKPLSVTEIDGVLDDITSRATSINVNKKSGTTQIDVGGGYDQALADFERLTVGIKPEVSDKGTIFATLPDGRVVDVRDYSSGNSRPTLGIIDKSERPYSRIKFRY